MQLIAAPQVSQRWGTTGEGSGASDTPCVCLLADDLTGACDAAVAFAARGLVTEVAVSPYARPERGCEVWAWSIGTRDVSEHEAEARLTDALQRVSPASVLFKKIDSVFRGNTTAEVVTTVRAFPDALSLIAPAFPALGRTAREGVVRVADFRGEHLLPVVMELEARGCRLPVLPAGLDQGEIANRLRRYQQEEVDAVFCDAETQDDLQRLTAGARTLEGQVVWIGAGGLAHALAACVGPQHAMNAARDAARKPRSGDLLFFIGSDHPVTLAQVRALREHASRAGAESIVIEEVVRGVTTQQEIRAHMVGRSAERTGCLFMTGGDTAAFVCGALGIHSFRLEREFAPGLPEGVVRGGAFEGVPVILKSGGFGEKDVLCRIAQTFDSPAVELADAVCAAIAGCHGGLL